MKKKRFALVFMIICYVLAIGYTILFIFMSIFNKPINDVDTITYSGTIEKVSVFDNYRNNKKHYKIRLQEYDCDLQILSSKVIINIDKFNTLTYGDVVEFKIKKNKKYELDNSMYVEIISLKFDNEYLISLESYNVNLLNNFRESSLICMLAIEVFAIFGIIFNNVFYKQKVLLNVEKPKTQPIEESKSQT